MIQHLLREERSGILGSRGHIVSDNVDPKMRVILLDWVLDVCKMFKAGPVTFLTTANIVDAVLARDRGVDTANLQLVGVASLSLAVKYHEVQPVDINDLTYIADRAYKVEEILQMEEHIFKMLGHNIGVPQELAYLSAEHQGSGVHRKILCLIAIHGNKFLPSIVATAVTKIASSIVPSPSASSISLFKVPDDIIDACVADIVDTFHRFQRSNLKGWKKLKLDDLFQRITASDRALTLTCTSKHHRRKYFKHSLPQTFQSMRPGSRMLRIGEGTHGEVYECAPFAVKLPRLASDGSKLSITALREISILLTLNKAFPDDDIIAVRGISDDLRHIFFDLGLCNLKEWILRHGALSIHTQTQAARGLLRVLSHLEEVGCLHRDIKPENIIVFPNHRLVLADFGSARGCYINQRAGDAFTPDMCTIYYRAPEILFGSVVYDHKADIWSLLCVLYYIGTGVTLFESEDIEGHLRKIFWILGSPTEQTWPGVNSFRLGHLTHPVKHPRLSFFEDRRDRLSGCIERLLTKGLIVNPAHRPSAAQLLALIPHP